MATVRPHTRLHTGKSVHPLGALLEAHGIADKVVMTIYTLVIYGHSLHTEVIL